MVGPELIVRCGNCMELQESHSAIIDHWNDGKCPFYCIICGESFHNRIAQLRVHFQTEHNIKFKVARDLLARPVSTFEDVKIRKVPKDSNTGLYKCPACERSFKHRQPLSSHFTMVHKRSEIVPPKAAPTLSIVKQPRRSTYTGIDKKPSLPLLAQVNSVMIRNQSTSDGERTNNKKQTQFNFKKDLQMALKKVPSNEITITIAKKKPSEQMPKANATKNAIAKKAPSNDPRSQNVQSAVQPETTPQPAEIYPTVELKTELDYGYENYADYSNQYDGWDANDHYYSALPPNTLQVRNVADLQQQQSMFSMDLSGYASTSTNAPIAHGPQLQPQPSMPMQSELRIQNVQSFHQPSHHPIPSQSYANYHNLNLVHPHNQIPPYNQMYQPNAYMHSTQQQPMYMMHPTAHSEYYGS